MAIVEQERAETLPELDEPGQILMDAAAYIRENGWVNRSASKDGPRCVGMAIYTTGRERHSFGWVDASYRLHESLGFKEKHGTRSLNEIYNWNDNICESTEQAVEALERAAIGG